MPEQSLSSSRRADHKVEEDSKQLLATEEAAATTAAAQGTSINMYYEHNLYLYIMLYNT